jgi:hypothetical protein
MRVIAATPGELIHDCAARCIYTRADAFIHNERLYVVTLTWKEHPASGDVMPWLTQAPAHLEEFTISILDPRD